MLSHPAQGPGNLHKRRIVCVCTSGSSSRQERKARRRAAGGLGGGTPGDPESMRARKSLRTQETVRRRMPRLDSWGLQTQIKENKNKGLQLSVSPARFPCSLFSRAGEC